MLPTSSAHRLLKALAGCALAAGLATAPAAAQIAVFPVQNLAFGDLRAGQAELVSPDDQARRGEFEIVGTGRVTITLVLPAEMVSPSGKRLPLRFDKDDISLEFAETGRDRSFDPKKPHNINIKKKEGAVSMYVGGLALPTATQPPGRYSAAMSIQVVAPGT
jgi:hypothetical protein